MPKFSVKKPYTILIMVLIIAMLGGVSVTRMQMDLLPEFSLPYLIVITTYPGASPEKVEAEVSKPLESALGTVSGVENVVSHSYENYCIVQMEFADGTDMDSVLVKVSTAIDTVESSFPDECGTPSIMELSLDMMATQYLAVSYDGKDIEDLSKFVESSITPVFERQNGVASISTMGLIDKTINIELSEDKVDALNDQILGIANDAFEEAMQQLEDAKTQLEESEQAIEDGREELDNAQAELNNSKTELENGQQELNSGKAELANGQTELNNGKTELENQQAATYEQLAQASEMLEAYETYLAQKTAQEATKTALEAAIKMITDQAGDADTIDNTISGINTLKGVVIAAQIRVGIDQQTNSPMNLTDMTSPLVLAVGALTAAGQDTSAITVAIEADPYCYDTVQGILSGYSAGFDTALSGLETASTNLTNFQNQKAALELEMQVTQGIITAYETQLKNAGINYTDIEAAKLEAASGFANASTQIDFAQLQLDTAQAQLDAAQAQLDAGWDAIESGQAQIDAGYEQLEDGAAKIEEGWESYYDGLVQFEIQRKEALRSANADQLISLQTLAGIIYAQNFEMPAGYIDDELDNAWLLKIGSNYESLEELEGLVLCHLDDIGDVTLGDVADITIIDNADTTFTKLDGNDAVILSVFKSSTAGTNEVSKVCKRTIDNLEKKYDGLHILVMTDQGDYISMIVKNVVQNMVIGAALAIIILAIFLKDVMPTIVVAISIPLSVLAAIVAMYFSGISLNMMSLSGMALGIGMLVDNSIVVIENIYRLRGRGVEAPRAAVQGTKQVAGAVIASTLTTVCVFFPMVYTSGITRELLLPMALTIIFCLMASLFIAMTVVPASASTLLRKTKTKEHPWFDKIQDVYGKILGFCLKVKIIPLFVAIGLLAFSVWQVVRMGIVMIPNMTTNEISATVEFADDTERETAYSKMNEFLGEVLEIKGVGSAGAFAGGAQSLLVSTGSNGDNFLNYNVMVTTENENAGSEEVEKIIKEINKIADKLEIEVTTSTGMSEMSSMLGSGLSISIYGEDTETLLSISHDIMDIIGSIEGFTEISNGQEEAEQVLHLNIDKGYAMSRGLTVAQIYQEIAGKMTTSAKSISVTIDGDDMDVQIVNNIDPITYENLMDYTFGISTKDEDGNSFTEDVALSEFAELEILEGVSSINRENQTRYMTVTASVEEGYNATLLSRELTPLIEKYEAPEGYSVGIGGESEAVNEMVEQMILMMAMGLAFIYFVMVAQFQSLLSPFIVLFTVPLAFTGGLLALWITKENLSVISLMGLVVLLGTVVNNGIVFVDYANQLRIGGMNRRDALIATGKTRMRPILMTAMTTILAESSLIFGDDMSAQMGRGMALVIAGGLAYATLMTLFIIPVMYDILFKRAPLNVDTGSEDLDDVPDDAQEFIAQMNK